jgi:hypothetical protein
MHAVFWPLVGELDSFYIPKFKFNEISHVYSALRELSIGPKIEFFLRVVGEKIQILWGIFFCLKSVHVWTPITLQFSGFQVPDIFPEISKIPAGISRRVINRRVRVLYAEHIRRFITRRNVKQIPADSPGFRGISQNSCTATRRVINRRDMYFTRYISIGLLPDGIPFRFRSIRPNSAGFLYRDSSVYKPMRFVLYAVHSHRFIHRWVISRHFATAPEYKFRGSAVRCRKNPSGNKPTVSSAEFSSESVIIFLCAPNTLCCVTYPYDVQMISVICFWKALDELFALMLLVLCFDNFFIGKSYLQDWAVLVCFLCLTPCDVTLLILDQITWNECHLSLLWGYFACVSLVLWMLLSN